MQDLNDMVYFAEVVDRGGFTAAGRSLGIPKSKLSRRIGELEIRLGVRLMYRTTRKLSLTDAGEIFYRHCVALRREAIAANEALALVQSEPRGSVRVTCPVNLAQSFLGPILPRFIKAYPKVCVELQTTNRAVDLVQEGVDIALRVRADVEDSASLIVKDLGPVQTVLVASPELLRQCGKPSSFADLAHLPTIAMSAKDGYSSWTLAGPDAELVELSHRPVYTADDILMLKLAALEAIGMTVLPESFCHKEIGSGSLEVVLAGWAPPVLKVLAVFPSRRGMVPSVRCLLDFLSQNIAETTAEVMTG